MACRELIRRSRLVGFLLAALSIGALCGCETFGEHIPNQEDAAAPGPRVIHGVPASAFTASLGDDARAVSLQPLIQRGREDSAGAPADSALSNASDGGFVMNFDGVDVRDIAKSVLGDQLGANYVVDPAAKATITLHTARPLPRAAVVPALADAFRVAGLALVRHGADYRILRLADGARQAPLSEKLGASDEGYQIRIIPLRWVTPTDIGKALEPLLPGGAVITSDPHATFVVVAGSPADLDRAVRAVALFDVDWMRRRSFGLFPLKYSAARDVANDLMSVVGKQGDDTVQITPIEHLNAVLIVSKTYERIQRLRTWIDRFDRGRDTLAPKIYIYRVQNGPAKELASLLSKVFGAGDENGSAKSGSGAPPATLSPSPSTLTSPATASPGAPGEGQSPFGALAQTMNSGSAAGDFLPLGASAHGSELRGGEQSLRITADESNNSLVIVTTPKLYAKIEAALVQLDAAPTQVLIEAAVAEVDLTDTFQYGVQTSIQAGTLSVLSSNVAPSAMGASPGGLSIALSNGGTLATLNLLSSLTKTKVISAPNIMVVNNKAASLEVGDQVPVATSSSVSTQSADAPVVNTIQMVDTGIILHVTPHVNNSGLVMLELGQEVSASVPTTSSNIDSPTIQQRKVSTTVQLEDGQTIIIGGLISDTRSRNRVGVPFLKDVPVIGTLFSTTNDETDRNELMVLLTPHIIRNGRDADEATDELRAKLPMLRDFHVK